MLAKATATDTSGTVRGEGTMKSRQVGQWRRMPALCIGLRDGRINGSDNIYD